MKIEISIFLIALLLALAPVSQTYCLVSTQLDGLCTSCTAPLILISGYCITPMAGCSSQLSNNICGQCSIGFILSNHACIPTGVTAANPNPVSLTLYTNTCPDNHYEILNLYFKQKYNQNLKDKISDITQLITLPTTYGFIYTITYFNPYSNTSLYRGEGLVDYFYNITEYSFGLASSNSSNMLWFLNRKVVVSHLPTLSASLLNKIQQFTSNDYRLFFLDFAGNIEVIDVQRTPNLSSAYRTFADLTQLYYEINQNTVINYVFSEFPNLQLYDTYTASYYTLYDIYDNSIDYFKFIFDNQVVVIIQVNGLSFSVESYQEPDSIAAATNASAILNLPGGYLPFLTLTDPLYLSVYNYLLSKYAYLAYKNVQEVRYQLVAGTNFMITFHSQPFSDDLFVALAYQPLHNGQPVINSLYKNGMEITNVIMSIPLGAYNYEADAKFKSLYTYFQSAISSQLGNLLPIYEVLYVANANNTFSYQVIYSSAQSALLQYSPGSANPYLILSYSAMGIQIPFSGIVSSQTGDDVSRNSIIQFLKQENPALFGSLLIISETQNSPRIYNLDILTPFGTYFARVVDSSVLYLSAISLTSTNQCSDLSRSQFTNNTVVAALNSYLTSNYQILSGFSLQLVQGFMANSSINYRFLYSSGQNRYEFLMIYSNQIGKYLTNKVTLYNGGNCDPTSILIGSSCTSSCQSFIF